MTTSALPPPVQRLINELARLPGIGPKSAARLTFYLLRGGEDLALDLAQALQDLKERTQFCSICFNITEEDPCLICQDEARDQGLLCVVEEPLDLLAIERSRAYNGRYHVLHGAISPVEGIGRSLQSAPTANSPESSSVLPERRGSRILSIRCSRG